MSVSVSEFDVTTLALGGIVNCRRSFVTPGIMTVSARADARARVCVCGGIEWSALIFTEYCECR